MLKYYKVSSKGIFLGQLTCLLPPRARTPNSLNLLRKIHLNLTKISFPWSRRSSQRAVYLTGIDKYERLHYLSYVSSWFYFLYGFVVSKPYLFFTADPPGPLVLVFDVNWFLAEEYPGNTTFLRHCLTIVIFSSSLFSEESDKENVHYSRSTCKVFRHELLRYEKSKFS